MAQRKRPERAWHGEWSGVTKELQSDDVDGAVQDTVLLYDYAEYCLYVMAVWEEVR